MSEKLFGSTKAHYREGHEVNAQHTTATLIRPTVLNPVAKKKKREIPSSGLAIYFTLDRSMNQLKGNI